MDDTSYQNSLDYIYSFVDYSLTRAFRYSPEKFNLTRMEELLSLINDPHYDYPIIHLAGTKGKGSTAAFIASAYQTEGYRVGFYSSPHLIDFCERIQVNGRIISHHDFVSLVNFIRPLVEQVEHITTFELTTAIAFLFFSIVGVDVAVIETGLGGRLDATNVVNPIVSVITPVSFDHTAVLGDTIEKISAEKAGIIKPGKPVVMGIQNENAGLTIKQIAAERNSELFLVGRDYHYRVGGYNLQGQSVTYEKGGALIVDGENNHGFQVGVGNTIKANLPLLGKHQAENGCTAFAALDVARNVGIDITNDSIQKGFESVFWPARFEVLQDEPPIIIDSAHNPDSARRLSQAISEYVPNIPLTLIFGVSEDKDVVGMFAELASKFDSIVITESFHPRAMDPSNIKRILLEFGREAVILSPLEKAVDYALSDMDNKKAGIIASGSLFIASAVRDYLTTLGYKIRNFEIFPEIQGLNKIIKDRYT